jgi:hypothetical protein
MYVSRTIAEVVSRWLPTAVARVWQVGFVVDKVALGAGFLQVLQFLLPKTVHSTNFSIITITRVSYELITHPRSPADCPRSSNRNETESFMEAAKAQNWAVEPQKKKKEMYVNIFWNGKMVFLFGRDFS